MPDRSVSVVVDEKRGLAAEALWRWSSDAVRLPEHDEAARAAADAMGLPAMVEALAQLADGEKVENADPLEWATWAHELAVAVLGGEVQGRPPQRSTNECPTCGAPPNHPCSADAPGVARDEIHPERLAASTSTTTEETSS